MRDLALLMKIGMIGVGVVTGIALMIVVIDDTPTATWASLALTPEGLPVIAYGDGFDLKLATCADPVCSAPTITVLSTNFSPVGDGGVPLLIGPNGAPIVIYAEGDPSSLMITICEDTACLDFTAITAVPGPGAGGYPLSATLNNQGHVVAFYYNPMFDGYHLMVCNDALCSAPMLTVFGEQITD